MSVIVTVQDIDMGYDATRSNLTASNNTTTSAGLWTRKLAQRGVWQEFGTSKIPARPWLSVAADKGQAKIARSAQQAAGDVADRVPPDEAFVPVGETMKGLAVEVLDRQRMGGPRLKAATIRRKLSKGQDPRRLIATGEMRNGIKWRVKARGKPRREG